jgi:hypothetical protein
MAIKTQGTELYVVDPADNSVINVGCVTSIDGIDTSVEQVETTCLGEQARSYIAGLATPGAASFGINTDTGDASHIRLHQLKVAGTSLQWAVGWSDGTADPTADSAGDFVVPATRSWITFEGFMNSYPFSFQQNNVVQSNIGIQVSGEPALVAKSA